MPPAQPRTRQVQCQQCLAVTTIAEDTDPHAVNWCRCCPLDHHHGQAAAACPGAGGAGHPGQPCPHPNPAVCTRLTPPGEPCPGGHCGPGVPGCTVCRPVVHFAVAGQPQFTN